LWPLQVPGAGRHRQLHRHRAGDPDQQGRRRAVGSSNAPDRARHPGVLGFSV